MGYHVTHNEGESRFEISLEGKTALVDYRKKDNVIIVTHTEVPAEFEGRGIAAALTKCLLDYARLNNLQVLPLCSYTKAYLQRHNEYADIVAGQ